MRRHSVLPNFTVVALALATAESGCLYVSDYVPPTDGRARVIWRGNRAVPFLSGDKLNSKECAFAVASLSRARQLLLHNIWAGVDGSVNKDALYSVLPWLLAKSSRDSFYRFQKAHLQPSTTYWQPRFYYPKTTVDPLDFEFGVRPVFDRRMALTAGGARPALGPDSSDGDSFIWQVPQVLGLLSTDRTSLGDSKGWLAAHLFLNTTATLLSPFFGLTALYPALALPGSAVQLNHAANLVNAYNDLARTEGNLCSYSYSDVPPTAPLSRPAGGKR